MITPVLTSAISETHAAIGPVCDAVIQQVMEQKTALTQAAFTCAEGGLAAEASGLDYSNWQRLLNDVYWSAVIHPFQEGVGQGQKMKTLSAPNAVNALAEKLNDGEFLEDSQACVLVMLTAKNYHQLQQVCEQMGDWLLWPEIISTAHKARDLLCPVEYENPQIVSPFINSFVGINEKNILGEMSSLIALAEGQQEQTPADELSAWLDEKETLAATHADVLANITALMPGVSVQVNFATGADLPGLVANIKELDQLGYDNSHCVLLALGGTNDNLSHWKEVFGL